MQAQIQEQSHLPNLGPRVSGLFTKHMTPTHMISKNCHGFCVLFSLLFFLLTLQEVDDAGERSDRFGVVSLALVHMATERLPSQAETLVHDQRQTASLTDAVRNACALALQRLAHLLAQRQKVLWET
jgi:hypothetical protein